MSGSASFQYSVNRSYQWRARSVNIYIGGSGIIFQIPPVFSRSPMTPPCSALAAACLDVLTHATSNTPIRAESLGRVTVNRRVAGSNPAWGARHHPFGIRGGWLTASRSVIPSNLPQNRRGLAHRGRPVDSWPEGGEPHRSDLSRGSADYALLLSAYLESLRLGHESHADAGPRAYLPAPAEPCPTLVSGGIVEVKDSSNDNQTGTSRQSLRPAVR